MLFRDGVITPFREGIAAKDSPYCHKSAFEGTETGNSLNPVNRTYRVVFTARRCKRRDELLITPYKPNKQAFHFRTPASFSSFFIERRMS